MRIRNIHWICAILAVLSVNASEAVFDLTNMKNAMLKRFETLLLKKRFSEEAVPGEEVKE